jgi:hypothetical protein
MGLVGNTPWWGMFAPDPPSLNGFVRVLVEDRDGKIQDLRHDIYGRRGYPYLFYDRLGKINRRLIDRKLDYRPVYASWVCRDWARTHRGDPPRAVRFVTIWTQIPTPLEAYRSMGYDPMSLKLNEEPGEAFDCDAITNGRLPSTLRARYGFAAGSDGGVPEVPGATWRTRPRAGEGSRDATNVPGAATIGDRGAGQ